MNREDYNIRKWYVFGDSIGKGIIYNLQKDKYEILEQNFINILAERFEAEVQNFSGFGATINKGLKVFARNQKKLEPLGIAIIEFGGNDSDFNWPEVAATPRQKHLPNTPFLEFKTNYQLLIEKLTSKKLLPVILNLPPLDPKRYFEKFSRDLNKENLLLALGGSVKRIYQWHESYNDALAEIAIQTQSVYINLRGDILQKLHPEEYICPDGIHPNPAGHRLIADIIYEKTKNYF